MSTPAHTYNYETFRLTPHIDGGCDGPISGQDLGDYRVYRHDGAPSSLSELVDGLTVIETGSTTCPLYASNVSPMRAVSEGHPGVRFLMLYTREAHPGGSRSAHTSLQDKVEAASGLPSAAGE